MSAVPTRANFRQKPVEGERGRSSGCQVVEVEFCSPTPENIGCITFINQYTHRLTLKYCTGQISNSKSAPAPSQWKTCIQSFELMPNCHCERGSQGLVVLNKAHFSTPLDNVNRLRFILRQPSPCWKNFGIKDLKCYSVSTPFHQDVTWESGSMGMELWNNLLSEKMEQVLQTGLCTGSNTDMESSPKLRNPYTVSVLSYT